MKSESLVMKLFSKLQPSFKRTCEAEGGFPAPSLPSVSRAVQGALFLQRNVGYLKKKAQFHLHILPW